MDLFEWGKVESNLCSLCQRDPESVVHLFLECPKIQSLVNVVKNFVGEFSETDLGNNNFKQNYMFCLVPERLTHIVNFVAIHIKQFIYSCKIHKHGMSKKTWLDNLKLIYQMELANARCEHKGSKVIKKWSPIVDVIDTLPATSTTFANDDSVM